MHQGRKKSCVQTYLSPVGRSKVLCASWAQIQGTSPQMQTTHSRVCVVQWFNGLEEKGTGSQVSQRSKPREQMFKQTGKARKNESENTRKSTQSGKKEGKQTCKRTMGFKLTRESHQSTITKGGEHTEAGCKMKHEENDYCYNASPKPERLGISIQTITTLRH